jgi:signal peptidase I
LIGAIHVAALARRWSASEPRHWYSRWYWLTGILLLFPLTALFIRAFLFQLFDIPSTSMNPSLNQGDYFFVSKFRYGWSDPQRGDIIVFRVPQLDAAPYVKRIVGLPGDKVQMKGGVLYINGAPVKLRRVGSALGDCVGLGRCPVPQFAETLPGGHTELILDSDPNGPLDNTQVFTVPANSYFVLGDNRDNSRDSREDMGFVSRDSIIGRASYKFAADGHWTWNPVQ